MATPARGPACCYCQRPTHTDEPHVQHPDGERAHVPCEIVARRQNRGHA